MSATNGKRKPRRRVRVRLEDDAEDVGYGKPPRRHQFKPGQSGNPKGRKKSGGKQEITILQDLLQGRKVTLNERGKTRKITVLEAILRRVAEDCLHGNIKSVGFLLNRYYAAAAGDAAQGDLSEEDKAVLEAYLREFKSKPEDDGGQS